MRSAAVGMVGLLVAGPAWADASGFLRASLGGEFDSNAQRAVQVSGSDGDFTFGDEEVSDGLFRFVAEGQGRWRPRPSWELGGRFMVGTKRFFTQVDQDLLTYDVLVRGRKQWGRLRLSVFAGNKLSRVRNGVRDYGLSRIGTSVVRYLGPTELSLQVEGWEYDFETFDTLPGVNYVGPRLTAAFRWRMLTGLTWTVRTTGVLRLHEEAATAIVDIDGMETLVPLDENRRDRELQLVSAFDYTGTFVAGLGYIGRLQRSNSDTENIDRHRIIGYATFGLPWRLFLSLRGALQFNFGRSDTNLRLSGDADENQNSIQARLRREITQRFSVEVGYALYANQFSSDETSVQLVGDQGDFLRQTVFLGVTGYIEGRTRD
jgi:hypothetical protein